MAQGDAELSAGEYDHFYNRGHNRGKVFLERDNYLFFLLRVAEYLSPVLDVVAYCLMPTHYHLLAGVTKKSDVSKTSDFSPDEVSTLVPRAMQKLGISHAKAINKRYARTGSLFQGAYRYKHIGENEYLVHLSRYIHLNPVFDGLVERPEEWEFSSYREYVGVRKGRLLRPDIVLTQFDSVHAYAQFVESYVPQDRAVIAKLL